MKKQIYITAIVAVLVLAFGCSGNSQTKHSSAKGDSIKQPTYHTDSAGHDEIPIDSTGETLIGSFDPKKDIGSGD